jgi:3-oxoacyl-[acyl-carrier protein] reductase
MTLAGQVALVTGSSQRLGRVIALAYAREGAKVVVNGATNRAALDQTVADAQALGARAIGCLADVRDRAAVDAMVAQAGHELGPIDILVNCPAPREEFPFEDLPADVWRRTMDIVLGGSFNCTQAVIPGMLQLGQGTILNIIGIAGQTGRAQRAHIVSAKSGLVGLTKSLAVEFAARGITVNAISPAFLKGERAHPRERPPAAASESPSGGGGGPRLQIPVGRQGTREEVAALCMYLSSDQARYVTGQNYAINGGAYI